MDGEKDTFDDLISCIYLVASDLSDNESTHYGSADRSKVTVTYHPLTDLLATP